MLEHLSSSIASPVISPVISSSVAKSVLGIDVSKDTLACTLLNADTQKPIWFEEVKNDKSGWQRLLKCTPADSPWILEPTGRYSQSVARAGKEAGRDVRLAQPRQAKFFLQSVQTRAKTDKLDSKGLAQYGLLADLKPYPLKNEMQEELDQLLLVRKGFSQSLKEWKARQKELPRAAAALEPAITQLKAQLQELDKSIAQLTRKPELEELQDRIQELQKVPGIGPVVAATVVSKLMAYPFRNSDQFVAYCGLDIRIRQSGKKSGEIGLSKHGDAELRRLLYLAAQASLAAKDSPFKAQYQRECAKGLPSTAAICSIARKMARLVWSIVHKNSSYDPDRVYDQKLHKTT
jgi:transposase